MKSKLLIPFIAAIAILTGCADQEETVQPEIKMNYNEQPTLTVWTDKGGKEALESAVESFQAQYGYDVKIEEVDPTKQRVKLEGAKQKPDVVVLPHEEIGLAISEELLLPITPEKETTSHFYEAAMETMKFNGELYGLPKNVDLPVFVYNSTFMNEAPKTFEVLKTFISENQSEDVTPFAFDWTNYKEASFIFNSFGSELFPIKEGAYDVKQNQLGSTPFIEALTFLNTWYDEALLSDKKVDVLEGLEKGTVVSGIVSLQDYVALKEKVPTIEIEAIPNVKENEPTSVYIETTGWFVTKETKEKDMALKFIEHVTNADNSSFRSETTNEIVPIKTLLSKEGLLEEEAIEEEVIEKTESENEDSDENAEEKTKKELTEQDKTFRQVVITQLETAKAYPNIPQMKDVLPQIDTAIRLTIQDTLDEKTALEYASKELSILIQADY